MPRPTKLTPEISDKICSALKAGNYVDTAAAYAGIVKDTFYEWLRRGARASQTDDSSESETLYREFHQAVEEAIASSEIRDVALIAKAATEQWQAAAWRLERRYPDRWGRREKHELSGPQGGPIQTVAKVVNLPPLRESADATSPVEPDAEAGRVP